MTTTHLFRGNERGEILDASGQVVGRIVPVEPTEAMITAAREMFGPHTEDTDSDYRRILECGLSAAPADWSGVAVRVPENPFHKISSLHAAYQEALDAITGVK